MCRVFIFQWKFVSMENIYTFVLRSLPLRRGARAVRPGYPTEYARGMRGALLSPETLRPAQSLRTRIVSASYCRFCGRHLPPSGGAAWHSNRFAATPHSPPDSRNALVFRVAGCEGEQRKLRAFAGRGCGPHDSFAVASLFACRAASAVFFCIFVVFFRDFRRKAPPSREEQGNTEPFHR